MMTQHLHQTVLAGERSSSKSQQKERAARVGAVEEGYWTLAPTSGLAREKGRERRAGEEDGEALVGRARVKGSKIRVSCHLEVMRRRRKVKAKVFTYSGHWTLYQFLWYIPLSFYTISLHYIFFAHYFLYHSNINIYNVMTQTENQNEYRIYCFHGNTHVMVHGTSYKSIHLSLGYQSLWSVHAVTLLYLPLMPAK